MNDWALLSDFPDADLIAFTTYPCIIYKEPADIPADYYRTEEHISKPIAYTEAGWFRIGFEGWESSAEEQARFITLYIERTMSLKPELLVWSFLYEQDAPQPFTTMSFSEKTPLPPLLKKRGLGLNGYLLVESKFPTYSRNLLPCFIR